LTENTSSDLSYAMQGASAVILPYPLSPDGVYLSALCDQCHINLRELFACAQAENVKTVFAGAIKPGIFALAKEFDLTLTDYADSEELLLKNALCTAEGALSIIMNELPTTVFGSRFTVIGYGRIGSMIAKMLKSLGAEVFCSARRAETRVLIELDGHKAVSITDLKDTLPLSDAVFNTVPSPILTKDLLKLISDDCVTVDLASSPGGVDFDMAEKLGKRVIWARALPGKYSPKTAASIIKESLIPLLET